MTDKQNPALVASSKPGDKELLHAINSIPPGKVWECPCCLKALPFQNLDWLVELEILLAKYGEGMGLRLNLAGLSLSEQWGHYTCLKRIEANQ
jgi:hypothetical protein